VAGGVWAVALIFLLTVGGNPVERVLALPFHWLCLIEIAGLSVVPGWALFGMLRRAAPMRRTWSAALAAALRRSCAHRRPSHQLVGHFLPVALLSVWGAVAGRRWLTD
jgi:hypothetical protein